MNFYIFTGLCCTELTYLSRGAGQQPSESNPPRFYKINLSTLSLLVLFFNFFSGLLLSFHLKIVVFKENIAENCRMPGLCQIHIKGEIAVLPNFSSKYPKNWYYIS